MHIGRHAVDCLYIGNAIAYLKNTITYRGMVVMVSVLHLYLLVGAWLRVYG